MGGGASQVAPADAWLRLFGLQARARSRANTRECMFSIATYMHAHACSRSRTCCLWLLGLAEVAGGEAAAGRLGGADHEVGAAANPQMMDWGWLNGRSCSCSCSCSAGPSTKRQDAAEPRCACRCSGRALPWTPALASRPQSRPPPLCSIPTRRRPARPSAQRRAARPPSQAPALTPRFAGACLGPAWAVAGVHILAAGGHRLRLRLCAGRGRQGGVTQTPAFQPLRMRFCHFGTKSGQVGQIK